jgi:hypothetical protein
MVLRQRIAVGRMAFALCATATVSSSHAQEPTPPVPPPGATTYYPPGPPPNPTQTAPQPVPPPPQPAPAYLSLEPGYSVPIQLTSDVPDLGYEIYQSQARPGRDTPYATCPGPCVLYLPPGDYHFRVTETETTLAGSRKISVYGPSTLRFDPDTRSKRTTGLIFGIGGPLLMVGGVVAVVGASCVDCAHAQTNGGLLSVGIVMILGGLTLTPVGWVMFGTSFKPEYEVRPMQAGPATGRLPVFRNWTAGVAPTPGGAAFAAQLRF